MYGMHEENHADEHVAQPQIVIPDDYLHTVRNAHNVAESIAQITRAKSKMTKILRACFITAGVAAGYYAGLKMPQGFENVNLVFRHIFAAWTAIFPAAIGAAAAQLTAWLWYRRPLNNKKANINEAARLWYGQENNFLLSMRPHIEAVGLDVVERSISHAFSVIPERLILAPYTHDQHYIDAIGKIRDRLRAISHQTENNHNPELQSFIAVSWSGLLVLHTLMHF